MHPNPRKIAPIILILALASLAYWYFGIYAVQSRKRHTLCFRHDRSAAGARQR